MLLLKDFTAFFFNSRETIHVMNSSFKFLLFFDFGFHHCFSFLYRK